MKTKAINQGFDGARRIFAALTDSTNEKVVSPAALVLLLFFLFSSYGCIGLTGASKPGSGSPGASGSNALSVQPSSIKFGLVSLGQKSSQSVTLSNQGASSITITQASTTTAGVTVSGISLPLTLAAGKQSTFDVIFSPKTAGALSGNISIMNSVSGAPSTVSLSGTATAATALLTSSAPSLNFGNVAPGKSSTLSVTLTNAGNSDVTISKVSVSGARYTESGVSGGLTLTPGQSATLDATFSPLAAGSASGSVTVASNATNSPATISLIGDGAQTPTQTVAHSVSLSWAPSSSAVAGYDVYRAEVSGGPYAKLDSSLVTADTFTDTAVSAGLTYYYVVTAVTSFGVQSADSTQASATVPTP